MSGERELPPGPCHLRAVYTEVSITGDLPDSIVGDTVAFAYTVTTPNTPATCVIASGALPPGLEMDSAGAITGQVITPGDYAWEVRATDAHGYVATHGDSCVVTQMTISGRLPQGYMGQLDPVSYQYTASGGITPRVFSVSSGALPTGLSMGSDGLVTGNFTDTGTFTWAVQVEDAIGNTATVSQTMTIQAITTLDPSTLTNPPGSAGGTISADNLTLTKTNDPNGFSVGARAPTSSLQTSGKFYIEYTVIVAPNRAENSGGWFELLRGTNIPSGVTGNDGNTFNLSSDTDLYLNGVRYPGAGPAFSVAGQTVGIAVNAATGKVWWRNAAGWNPGGDPSTDTGAYGVISNLSGGLIPAAVTYASNGKCRVNFGQEPFKLGDVPDGFFGGWLA